MLSWSISTKEASSSFYKEFPLKILIYLVLTIIPKDRTSKSLEDENERHQRANNIFHSHLLKGNVRYTILITRTFILISLLVLASSHNPFGLKRVGPVKDILTN